MVDFKFQKNDHTAAELLLWPNGFQQYTPTPDDELFKAYAGTDAVPAIADKTQNANGSWTITGNRFDPDIGAELYITNGDLTDDAYAEGILAYTPEGSVPDDPERLGQFEFQDVEADIQQEFLRHKQFVLDLARSADDPANPISHLGNTVQNFYVETFTDSYGDPQPVQVVAKKSLGDVRMRYRINDGAVRTVATSTVHRRRALRAGTRPLLPPPARHRDGDESRRRGRGVVRGRPPVVEPLHLHGARGDRQQGADPERRELHGPACRTTRTRAGRTT